MHNIFRNECNSGNYIDIDTYKQIKTVLKCSWETLKIKEIEE